MVQWLKIRLPMQGTGDHLSPGIMTVKPVLQNAGAQSSRAATTEACTPRLERAHAAKKTHHHLKQEKENIVQLGF